MSIVALAKDLGISVGTVSRALNGYEDVSEATRQRVFARVKETGYRPNPGARRLKTGKTSAIGVVLPAASTEGQILDATYSSLLGGVALEVEKEGYHLHATLQARQDPEVEAGLYENFIRGGWVDAILIVRTRIRDPRIALAHKNHVPFVTYGRSDTTKPYSWVDTDNEKAFYLATRRQFEFGHQRIALLNAPAEFFFARLRQQGYERAFGEKGIAPDKALMVQGDMSEKSGYNLCRALLERRQPPTSFVCATDTIAVGAIAACRERGLKVGSQVSVMGYGNSNASAYSDPPLTTIEHQVFENGRHIGQTLLRLLKGEAPQNFHYLEPVVLVPRGSDGPLVGGA